MDSEPNFEIKIEKVTSRNLIKFEGARGPFYIKRAGGIPELKNGFFYGDAHYQFCFYVGLPPNGTDPKKLDIVVFDATTKILGDGFKFKADREDVAYLERNIRTLFETRTFYDLRRELEAPYFEIRFSWNIARETREP